MQLIGEVKVTGEPITDGVSEGSFLLKGKFVLEKGEVTGFALDAAYHLFAETGDDGAMTLTLLNAVSQHR